MTNKTLETLLRMCVSGPAERKVLAERLPNKMRAYQDGKVYEIDNVREFILSEDLEGSGLVQYEIDATVRRGAVAAKCVRDVFPIINMTTDQMRIPYGNSEVVAPTKKEGAEFQAMYQDYNYRTLTAEVYGNFVPITEELIDDAKFDIVAIELEKMGRNLEGTLNQMGITKLLDNAGKEHDTTGSNQGLTAVIKAKALCMAAGFIPDSVIMTPEAWGMVFLDYKPAYNPSAEDTLRAGVMPQIVGLKPFVCSVPDASSTYTWEYNSDGDIGMLVVDAVNAGVIGMRKDITVKMHEDPLKMLRAPTVSARWDFAYLQANAICRVKY